MQKAVVSYLLGTLAGMLDQSSQDSNWHHKRRNIVLCHNISPCPPVRCQANNAVASWWLPCGQVLGLLSRCHPLCFLRGFPGCLDKGLGRSPPCNLAKTYSKPCIDFGHISFEPGKAKFLISSEDAEQPGGDPGFLADFSLPCPCLYGRRIALPPSSARREGLC